LAEAVRLAVGESDAVGVPVADADADALPVEVADPDGEGVVDPVPEWEVAEICGVGVKTDDAAPPVQPATVTATTPAPAAARTARRHTPCVTADPVIADGITTGPVDGERGTAGRVATGAVRSTFMKPPRIPADNGSALPI
jgi:hypothetical protein